MAEPTDAQDPATDAGAAPQPDNADHLSEYSTETGDAAAAAPARPVARKPVVTGNAMGTGRRKEAIARALTLVDPENRPSLKRAGFLTRDARVKERKKAGLKKARKAPQYSKR